jgi:hypothetical protein
VDFDDGIFAGMRYVVALSVLALTGCAPLSLQPAANQPGEAKPAERGAIEPRCGRQFDAEGAGFQTCRAGESQPSE